MRLPDIGFNYRASLPLKRVCLFKIAKHNPSNGC
jgi:hypothetical protein